VKPRDRLVTSRSQWETKIRRTFIWLYFIQGSSDNLNFRTVEFGGPARRGKDCDASEVIFLTDKLCKKWLS
jgi:hypothetical protein